MAVVKKYGALVELEEGIEGLIPTPNLSGTRKAGQHFRALDVGDRVETVVTGVDSGKRQITLRLNKLSPQHEPE